MTGPLPSMSRGGAPLPAPRTAYSSSPPEQHHSHHSHHHQQQQRSHAASHHLVDPAASSQQQYRRDMLQYQQSSPPRAAAARPPALPALSSQSAAAAAPEPATRPRKTQACTRCSHLKVRCDGGTPCAKCVSTDRGGECFYRLALKRGPPKGCPPRGGIRKKQNTADAEGESEGHHTRVNSSGSTASQQQQQHQQHLQPLYDQHQTQQREPSYQATASYFSPFHAANGSPQAALRSLQGESEAEAAHAQAPRAVQQHEAHQVNSPRLPTPHWPHGTDARRPRVLPAPPLPPLPSPGASSTPRFLSDGMRYPSSYEARPTMPLRMPSHVYASPSAAAATPASASSASPPLTSGDEVLRNLDDHTETRLFRHLITYILAHWPLWHASTITSLKALRARSPTVWLAAIGIAAATADAPGFTPSGGVVDGIPARESPALPLSSISEIAVDAARSRVLNEGLSKPTIETTQALLLITLVELGRGHMSSAWSLGGLACRIALDLRLNESNERDSFSASASGGAIGASAVGAAWHEASVIQEERRTFWCLYALDRVLSAVFEKPALLRLQDISQPLPSASERDEFDVWLSPESARMVEPHALVHLEGVKTHALSSFRAWVGALKVLEVVQTSVYSRDARKDRSATRGAHEAARKALVEWTRSLPSHLRWDSPTIRALGGVDAKSAAPAAGLPFTAPQAQNAIVAPHHLTVRAWWCLVCMFLHRPWVSQAGSGSGAELAASPTQRDALEICVLAATEICEIMQCYENTYRSRKIPSSWPYLIFSAATTFAPLAGARASPASPFAAQSSVLLDKCLASLERVSQTWQIGRYHMNVLLTLERNSQPLRGGLVSAASPESARRASDESKEDALPEARRISAPTVGNAYSPSLASTNGGPGSPPPLPEGASYAHASLWASAPNGGAGSALGMSLPAAQGMGPALLSPGLPLALPPRASASPRGEAAPALTPAPSAAAGALPAQPPSAGSELWSLMPMAMPVVESDAIWETFMAGLAR